jgi:hypothetical protein
MAARNKRAICSLQALRFNDVSELGIVRNGQNPLETVDLRVDEATRNLLSTTCRVKVTL